MLGVFYPGATPRLTQQAGGAAGRQ